MYIKTRLLSKNKSLFCRTGPLLLFVATFWFVFSGCIGLLDTLGREEVVREHVDLFKDPQVEDDKIEDKNPTYDPNLNVTETFDDCTFTLNKSGSVTKLDVVAFEGDDRDLETRLFNDRKAALADLAERSGVDVLPSIEVINGALKAFNDGLYASIEMGVQQGVADIRAGKQDFLIELAVRLHEAYGAASGPARDHLGRALAHVAAGLAAGGVTLDATVTLDGQVSGLAQDMLDTFEAKVLQSTPIGFYTWNDTLQQIFNQDRFLQNRLAIQENHDPLASEQFGQFAAMAAVIKDATDLKPRYENILALYAGLTNPYAAYSVATLFDYVDGVNSLDNVGAIQNAFVAENPAPFVCRGTYLALFPASRAKDTRFFQELFCDTAPPQDVTTIDILINAIMQDELDLTPDPDSSGWYDYQLYALETLLVPNRGPESDHLLLTKAYKEKLIETFKSLITQTRETHVKQLETFVSAGAAPTREVDIYPKFPVEPFPTFYLRTARAYRFLKTYLWGVLGAEFMEARGRLFSDDTMSTQSLAAELDDMIRLTYGLYTLSCWAVGLDPYDELLAEETAEFPADVCVERANSWLDEWRQDPDIMADPRVIVPVGTDNVTMETIYWATVGIKVLKISAEFVEGYEPEVLSGQNNCKLDEIVSHRYYLLVEEMREVRIRQETPPPTRAEFRAICDNNESADAIVAALEAL
jgi:hypothetical protein